MNAAAIFRKVQQYQNARRICWKRCRSLCDSLYKRLLTVTNWKVCASFQR